MFDVIKDIHLFSRKLLLKVVLDKSKTTKPNYAELSKGYTVADFRALKDVILLMQESEALGPLDASILEQDVDTLLSRAKQIPSEGLSFPKYKSKSQAFPPLGISPNIYLFTTQVTRELRKLQSKRKSYAGKDNMTSELRKAIVALQKNTDIVIKPADKGGNTVVMDRPLYTEMGLKILHNKDWYAESTMEAFHLANSKLSKLILEAESCGIIDLNTRNFLINRHPRIPVFYALPKLQKGSNPLQGNQSSRE